MTLKTRFCAKCGKETASLHGGLCSACHLIEHPVSAPRSVVIKLCPKCKAIKWRGVWLQSDNDAEHYFKQLIEQRVKLPKNVTLNKIKILKTGKQGKMVLVVEVLGDLIKVEKNIDLSVDKFACPGCSRQKSEWAAKIQVRSVSGSSVDDVLAIASKYRNKIVRVERQKTGVDFYFFVRSKANKLASDLVKRFGFKLKKSYEQHGHDFDTGRPKHREIISVRK
tara:strand:- start:297 stop:965 length:669 start_codon:yes stop_codon:yes gene_type:complete